MSSFQKLLAEAYLLTTSNRTICSSETAWLRIFYLLQIGDVLYKRNLKLSGNVEQKFLEQFDSPKHIFHRRLSLDALDPTSLLRDKTRAVRAVRLF